MFQSTVMSLCEPIYIILITHGEFLTNWDIFSMSGFDGYRACPSKGMQNTTLLNDWMDENLTDPLAIHFFFTVL